MYHFYLKIGTILKYTNYICAVFFRCFKPNCLTLKIKSSFLKEKYLFIDFIVISLFLCEIDNLIFSLFFEPNCLTLKN